MPLVDSGMPCQLLRDEQGLQNCSSICIDNHNFVAVATDEIRWRGNLPAEASTVERLK